MLSFPNSANFADSQMYHFTCSFCIAHLSRIVLATAHACPLRFIRSRCGTCIFKIHFHFCKMMYVLEQISLNSTPAIRSAENSVLYRERKRPRFLYLSLEKILFCRSSFEKSAFRWSTKSTSRTSARRRPSVGAGRAARWENGNSKNWKIKHIKKN